jgi:predicted dithiol-disulfide oxidoreductase (DUF899 family)
MTYAATSDLIGEYRRQIADIRKKMRAAQESIEPQLVQDYEFANDRGEVRLSQLFGGKDDLIVIHNMGRSCPYCTLWADGYNGVYHHLADRAAFVLSSPDDPKAQREFAQSRGWAFPMVSHAGTSFAKDMGYVGESGGPTPGLSVFQRRGENIVRVSDAGFRPGDDYCAVWHILDLIPEGAAGWQPKFNYSQQSRAA